MGNYLPVASNYLQFATNYKHSQLNALCAIMIQSPKKLENILIEQHNIDLNEVMQYKWMGLNLLHLTEIFLGFVSQQLVSQYVVYKEYIELRKTIIKLMPQLLNDNLVTDVFFGNDQYDIFIPKGELSCKYLIPYRLKSKLHIIDGIKIFMYTDDIKKYNYYTISSVPQLFSLNKNLSRAEFIIKLQSVFINFPIYKKEELKKEEIKKDENEEQIEGCVRGSIPGGI
jgi:hypothetical protein